ncbi:MAG: DUF1499 domain-containing protein [Anaerolineae bacterium]|nr:DUF1499 domain-containing protein [Anaerolineae bacterium]
MPKFVKIIVVFIVAGLIAFLPLRWLIAQVSPKPDNLGVANGRLQPCPESPNCVSTQATDELHAIEPIAYDGATAAAQQKLLAILQADPSYTLISNSPTYIHAEARTAVWQFVDDVEFTFDEAAGLIHFRSASRLGYGDAGANRQRLEAVRAAFQTAR